MKKFLYFCASFALVSAILLFGFNIYQSTQDNNTETYTRFFTTDSTGQQHFNWFGVLSPVQMESQKVISDTIRFSHKVIYPYGKNFQCIAPEDSTAEQFVANQIAQVINDSIKKIRFNLSLDYDRTALAVRKSANPVTKKVAKPTVILSLMGTASPEARKYGFQESIMPGHLEPENDTLAYSRLIRTATILEQKGFKASSTSWSELQFSDTASAVIAIQNPAILDSLRWVEAKITIPIERLEITPATAPVLLPLWLWLLTLGLISLWSLRLPKMQRTKLIEWGPWSWGGLLEFLKILFFCVVASVLLTALIFFIKEWIFWILVLLGIACVILLAWLLWRYRKEIWVFFKFFYDLFILLFLLIWELFKMLFRLIKKLWNKFIKWLRRMRRRLAICWAALTPCWKRVFVIGFAYAVAMTVLAICLI